MASLFFRFALACAVCASACGEQVDPAAAVQIIPSSETVTLENERGAQILNVAIHLINTSANPILWSPCAIALERSQYVMALDRRTEDWIELWRPACAGDSSETQRVLKRGESVTVPVSVRAATTGGASFHGEPGVYRVRFFLSADIGGEYHQLPADLSVSRSFAAVDR